MCRHDSLAAAESGRQRRYRHTANDGTYGRDETTANIADSFSYIFEVVLNESDGFSRLLVARSTMRAH
jgi:hypothetical protein